MSLQTLHLEHIPQPHAVHIFAFKDVSNASYLREQLLAGNSDFEYAFIDASALVSTAHALAAVHQAVHNLLVKQKLRTRNVHSEIVFCLSPNNNITESFRRFGISETTTSLVCVKVSSRENPISAEETEIRLQQAVKGLPAQFNDEFMAQTTDWAKVAKCYKTRPGSNGVVTEQLELEVLGKMVMRAVG
ncbi:protein cgi121 [Sphaerosporella brunnea]|uniref:EKC/KEOPS complex subunit CGI121 n=1 Tax=Sphaerosporella brunnea TaxID=1250544 RepID=A0A5J5EBN6_9PEZI|nr:protein cgi121 [Sphaerosporella brunnea]